MTGLDWPTAEEDPPATSTSRRPTELAFRDFFDDDRPAGTVVGSRSGTGARRGGVDAEGLIGIDHGKLRLRPLARPGWGREGVAYGPYPRVAGLTMATRVLNGHNASQTYYFPESRGQRLRRVYNDAKRFKFRRPLHFENLAVGWFGAEAPADPLASGNALVMHAANRDNGELWAAVGHQPLRAVLGVQNLDVVYVVSLREQGAVYYAMTTPGAAGLGHEPFLRPLALDRHDATTTVYAGIHQRILGEVGYRVDTRVSAVCAEVVDAWGAWYGSASVADRLTGSGSPAGSTPEAGGPWRTTGTLEGTAVGLAGDGEAWASAPGAVGLVVALVSSRHGSGTAGVIFRAGVSSRWIVRVGATGTSLVRVVDGVEETVATNDESRLGPGREHEVQVTDDGSTIGVHLDGRLVFGRWITDDRDAAASGAGVSVSGDGCARDLEAHLREIPMPEALDVGPPWTLAGDTLVIDERFDAVADDLHGLSTPSGGVRWERTLGPGVIELPAGGAARVKASKDSPNPDRTVYTVEWPDQGCADVEIEMVPPGTARHQGEGCRVGLVFWQDADNFLIVNVFLDDVYDGASVSTFYHLGGHEDMYDAVWSLVWPLRWGEPCRLRAAFDGHRFLAWHDGRPVLQRALTDVYPSTPPIRVDRIGIIVNEEWGNDTGSAITSFRALRRAGTA